MRRKLGDAVWVLLGVVIGCLIMFIAIVLFLIGLTDNAADVNGMTVFPGRVPAADAAMAGWTVDRGR
ncbi:hypothetical protein ACFROC_11230 [Nocardia tengchongensis]|uniref:hypothetical protein n=1 Tax=Nocardia tengchongensis TaxID=2055889 RepID=UPI00368A71A8